MSYATEWPRLDLHKAGLVRLVFSATFPFETRTFELLLPHLNHNELMPNVHISAARYSRSKFSHSITQAAHLVEFDNGALAIEVEIGYDASAPLPPGRVPKEIRQDAILLPILRETAEQEQIACRAHFYFEYARNPHARTVLDVMPGLAAQPGGLVDEITGINGVKHGGTPPHEWSTHFALDRLSEGIALTLAFNNPEGLLDPDLVADAFDLAQLAAATLVFLK